MMDEERPVLLVNMPTTIRGFCYHDDDGEEFIILNSRMTHEANQRTWKHERRHIRCGDMFNEDYHEYEGR